MVFAEHLLMPPISISSIKKPKTMKHILFVLALLVFSISEISAQSQKNDLKLALSALPLLGSSGDFDGNNGLAIKSTFGYFISEKTSIDLTVSYAALNN